MTKFSGARAALARYGIERLMLGACLGLTVTGVALALAPQKSKTPIEAFAPAAPVPSTASAAPPRGDDFLTVRQIDAPVGAVGRRVVEDLPLGRDLDLFDQVIGWRGLGSDRRGYHGGKADERNALH